VDFGDFAIDVPRTRCRIRGSLPLCKLLKEPAKLQNVVLEDATHWKDHILLCTRAFNIVLFLATLRSISISTEEYKTVLILCDTLPNEEEAHELLQFPGIYLIQGDSRSKKDLIRAGIHAVDKIVLLNLGSRVDTDDEGGEYIDSNTMYIFTFSHL
jgi:hypothetical protein